MFGYSPIVSPSLLRIEVSTNTILEIKSAGSLPVDKEYLTVPKKISFPTDNGKSRAYGYLYLPKVGEFCFYAVVVVVPCSRFLNTFPEIVT